MMASVGYPALSTRISCAVIMMSTAWRYAGTSKSPFAPKNFIRLRDDRLQAESSKNIYSEQGLEALMRSVFLEVCQRLMVVSYCMPGSPHCHVALAILRSSSRALYACTTRRSLTERVQNSPSRSTACMNSSVTRTELLAFWKKMEL